MVVRTRPIYIFVFLYRIPKFTLQLTHMNFCKGHNISWSGAPALARATNLAHNAAYGTTSDARTRHATECAGMRNRSAMRCWSCRYAVLPQRPRTRRVLWHTSSHARAPQPPQMQSACEGTRGQSGERSCRMCEPAALAVLEHLGCNRMPFDMPWNLLSPIRQSSAQ